MLASGETARTSTSGGETRSAETVHSGHVPEDGPLRRDSPGVGWRGLQAKMLRPGMLSGVAVGLVLMHGFLVMWQFPARTVKEGNPALSVELAFHLAGAVDGYDVIARRHHIWGYSPRYMAGYPFGLWNSIGTRGYEMASAVLPFLPFCWAFYAWVVLTAFGPPLLIGLAARLLYRNLAATVLALALAVVIWQFGNIINYLWTSGMIAFPFVSSLAVLYAALLCRSWTSRNWMYPIAAGACLGAIFWLHSLVLLPAGVATLAVLLLERRMRGDVWPWVRIAAALCIGVVVALPWLLVLLRFSDLRGQMEDIRFNGGLKAFIMDFCSDRRYRFHFDRRLLFQLIVLLAAVGTVQAWRERMRSVAVMGVTAAGLLACAYLFPYSRFLEQTESYRYIASAKLFAIIPAVTGVGTLLAFLREANPAGRKAAAFLGLALLPGLAAYGFDFALRLRQPAEGLDPARLDVALWLKQHGEQSGRVLCADIRLGNVLPFFSGKEVIGGTIGDESVLPNSWTGCGRRGAFGTAALRGDAGGTNLAAMLRLYNVAYVVASPGLLRERLQELAPACEPVYRRDFLTVFAVRSPRGSYVWEADKSEGAEVTAEANRILICNAPPGLFTLKYHFLETLRSTPGTALRPVSLLGDPVPFIGVDNSAGLARVEISQRY